MSCRSWVCACECPVWRRAPSLRPSEAEFRHYAENSIHFMVNERVCRFKKLRNIWFLRLGERPRSVRRPTWASWGSTWGRAFRLPRFWSPRWRARATWTIVRWWSRWNAAQREETTAVVDRSVCSKWPAFAPTLPLLFRFDSSKRYIIQLKIQVYKYGII